MAEKRLLKELKSLSKTPSSATNHQVLHLYPENPEMSLYKWKCIIAKPFKTDSPYYYNGKWELVISVAPTYPNKPPRIEFSRKTPINHPNINLDTGEICLDILKDDTWSPAWNLLHLVGAILLLIDDPEPDSPLNVDSANLFRSDKTAFESMVQYTIWKHETLYEGTKESSGLKVPPSLFIEATSEEEDTDSVSDGDQTDCGYDCQTDCGDDCSDCRDDCDDCGSDKEKDLSDAGPELSSLQQPHATETLKHKLEKHDRDAQFDIAPSVEALDISSRSPETSRSPTRDLHNDEYIHDLGRQVTREFLKKATEVESSSPEDLSKSPSSSSLAAVHHHVTKNVAKQIEEICAKGASNPQPPVEKKTEKKPDVDKIKANFLQQIDKQVDEIRRNQELLHPVVQ